MSPRPAANSGTDNLGNYLILPFFAACWAYFLEYQMRPAVKIRQARGEASAPILLPLPPCPRLPFLQPLFGRPLTTQTPSHPQKASLGNTEVSGRRCAHEGSRDQDDVSCVQFCVTPTDCSPPGPSVHGIFQVRILEWAAISSSRRIFPTQGSNPHLLRGLHWQ